VVPDQVAAALAEQAVAVAAVAVAAEAEAEAEAGVVAEVAAVHRSQPPC
jgi:hypothetical protein